MRALRALLDEALDRLRLAASGASGFRGYALYVAAIRIESHESLAKQNGGKNVCYRRSNDVSPRRNDLRNNRGCSRRHALYAGLGHKWKNGGPHVYR